MSEHRHISQLMMNMQGQEVYYWTLFLLLGLLVLVKLWFLSDKNTKAKPIPSPGRGIPVLGHLHLLGKLPHRSLANLAKKHGPVMLLRLGSEPTVVVSSSAMAREILKTHDHNFATRPHTSLGKNVAYNFRDIAFSLYGPSWKSLRKLTAMHLLGPKSHDHNSFIMKEEIYSMLKTMYAHAEREKAVNLSELVGVTTSNLICRLTFGRKFKDTEMEGKNLNKMVREAIRLAGAFNIGDFVPWLNFLDLQGLIGRQKKCHTTFDNFIESLIEERLKRSSSEQKASDKDFLDNMLDSMSSQDLDIQISREHVKATILDVLVAGTDAASVSLEWLLSEVVLNPHVMKKAQKEVDAKVGSDRLVEEADLNELRYVKGVVRETLRLHLAAPLLVPHGAIDTCKVGDYEIAKGTRVIVNAWAITHSEDVWEDAETFKPERFLVKSEDMDVLGQNFEVLPFGSGRRVCPGRYMALQWMEYILANMVRCFDLKLGHDAEELNMGEEFGLSVAKATPLVVVPFNRRPLMFNT